MDKLRACLVGPSCTDEHPRRTRESGNFWQLASIPVTGRFSLAREMGFDICVWYCLNNTTTECNHFPQGQAGGIMKACLCQVSFHQRDHCPTQPLENVGWFGPRSASGLTLAVRPLGGHHMQCSLHTGSPWVAKKSVLSPNLHGHNGFFGSDRRQQVFLR